MTETKEGLPIVEQSIIDDFYKEQGTAQSLNRDLWKELEKENPSLGKYILNAATSLPSPFQGKHLLGFASYMNELLKRQASKGPNVRQLYSRLKEQLHTEKISEEYKIEDSINQGIVNGLETALDTVRQLYSGIDFEGEK